MHDSPAADPVSPASRARSAAAPEAPEPLEQNSTAAHPLASGTVLYEEKLTPSVGVWLASLLVSSLAVLAFLPISLWVGIAASLVLFGVIAALLVTSTPQIKVTEEMLQVGRATIERRFVGRVTGYRGAAATEQRGPALHGLAYLCLRGWISPVVRIQITDEQDRTPYWLTSTRHPERLVEALGGQMSAPAAPEAREDDDVHEDAEPLAETER